MRLDYAVLHPDGRVSVRIDGHAFGSRDEAECEAGACDEDCDFCDGGRHGIMSRQVGEWLVVRDAARPARSPGR